MAAKNSNFSRLLVAAIDFGTTYSGYAFSFNYKPNDIHINPTWISGSDRLISEKCPSAVLLKPDKTFHSFGYEAENKFADLAEDDNHKTWYLFRRFKMTLYETSNLGLDTPVEDISGKKMPAIDIFAYSISFLKNHLWKTIQARTFDVVETDIQYVITVPAIWDQKAKHFMRKAANKANIPNDQISLALEPEAASLWCQVKIDDTHGNLLEPLAKYVLVDLGGGTADITVHEKMYDGSLREIHKATGGAWGGNEVDKAYLRMLEDMVKPKAMDTFKLTQMIDYFDLLRDFETKKRSLKRDNEGKITFKIPLALRELGESDGIKMSAKVAQYKGMTTSTWVGDKLRIEKVAAKELFAHPIQMLISHIKKLLTVPKIQDVKVILLAGGFSECDLVKEAFEHNFADKKLLIPKDAGLAVLKGAIRFGHFSDEVQTRIARYTIGKEVWPLFNVFRHDPAKKILVYGEERCEKVFHKFIEVGEKVPTYRSYEETERVTCADQTGASIKIFCSTNQHVSYVTDPGCQELGCLNINLPTSKNVSDKNYTTYYYFGDTEIHVRVKILKTNEVIEKWIDCFPK